VKAAFASLLVILSLSSSSGQAREGREIVDATGSKVKLADKPMRIVALAPSLGELAADLVQEELSRIVGVSEYTDYPTALKRVASIGPYHRFNLEKILSLKPDLVLATTDGNPKDHVQHLRELKLPVVVVNTGSFPEVESSMKLVGQAVGNEALGRKMGEQLKAGLVRLRERVQGKPSKSVVLQVGDEPLVVMAGQSFLHDALIAVGARNAYGDVQSNYIKPNIEDVLKRKPDLILVIAMGENLAPYHQMARRWMVLKREAHVMQADALVRPTARLLEGLALLERQIHGN
jgi:iron complex transport system substrate-binding protein